VLLPTDNSLVVLDEVDNIGIIDLRVRAVSASRSHVIGRCYHLTLPGRATQDCIVQKEYGNLVSLIVLGPGGIQRPVVAEASDQVQNFH
jgi:hypothetical protein